MSKLELPKELLGSVAADGGRVPLYPNIEPGPWRNRRTIVQMILIVVFLATPWIKINGVQLLLFDIIQRKFSIFGLTLWAHDGPIIFFILGIAFLGLAFVTSIWGRVWCGWACPQTVFIEGVFRRIETWVEGNHVKRKALDQGPWTPEKVIKKTIKWSVYAAVSLVITHSFLAYFVGSDRLLEMIQSDPRENYVSFIFILVTTGAILFDFSLFREQLCIFVCPYGRFQSVLLDKHSKVVSYDYNRGEPRKSQVPEGEQQGDCINCYKCVMVCPTGIDIRRGLQMECIHCTACIDACDTIMEKVNKPKGLIRYATEVELQGKATRYFKPRELIYLTVVLVCTIGLAMALAARKSVHISLVRAQDTPYSEVPNQSDRIINHYKLNLKNQILEGNRVQVQLTPEMQAQGIEVIVPINPVEMAAGELKRQHIFLKFPKSLTLGSGKSEVDLKFSDKNGEEFVKSLKIVGPTS